MSDTELGFFDAAKDAECAECGYQMAMIRTDVQIPIATLTRMECCNCDARGTVETRPEDSIAYETGVRYHGSAVEVARGDE